MKKSRLLVPLLTLGIGAWALMTPGADLRAQRVDASIAPPLAGIDPQTGQRIPHAPPARGEVRTMSIRALGNFSYDPTGNSTIPADVQRLNGLTVRLQGYMLATQQAGDWLTRFALVPSRFACCYGQPPGVQHIVIVQCPGSRPVAYCQGLVAVQGKLTVRAVRDDGYVVSLFELAATRVDPVKTGGG